MIVKSVDKTGHHQHFYVNTDSRALVRAFVQKKWWFVNYIVWKCWLSTCCRGLDDPIAHSVDWIDVTHRIWWSWVRHDFIRIRMSSVLLDGKKTSSEWFAYADVVRFNISCFLVHKVLPNRCRRPADRYTLSVDTCINLYVFMFIAINCCRTKQEQSRRAFLFVVF